MLYQEALRRLELARIAIEEGDHASRVTHLKRVRDIFNELLMSLDPSDAPEVVANWRKLYVWVIRETNRIGREKDASLVPGVQKVVEDLLDTWRKAIEASR